MRYLLTILLLTCGLLSFAQFSGGGVSATDTLAVNVIAEPSNLDAFGRLRTAGTGQRLDVEFIYDKQPEFFDEVTNNGTVTHNANGRDLTFTLSDANDGSYASMYSHPVPYTPGNSQLIDVTGVLDLANLGTGTAEVFLRSSATGSVTEEIITQSSWINNATGVDWSKAHIFQIDFQSLKVGSIRYFLVQGGEPVKLAQIDNDNEKTAGYWNLPSLPLYWRIYTKSSNTFMELGYGDEANAVGFRYKVAANASATMKAICGTVKSEGGLSLKDIQGIPRSVDNGVTVVSVSTTLVPILSIRLKDTFNTFDNLGIALPKSFSASTNEPIKLAVIHDGTLTGASWSDVDSDDSFVEYDVSASAISNGHVLGSEYVATTGGGNNRSGGSQGLLGKAVLWARKSGLTGILTIAAIRTGAVDASVLTSINWEEIR